MSRWAPLIDVLTPSLDDLWPAFPGLTVAAGAAGPDTALMAATRMADELVRGGVAVALVTAGRAGMCLRTAGPDRLGAGGPLLAGLAPDWTNRQLCAPSSASEPVRTSGAGDTATAGFLYGMLAGLPVDEALTLAAAAAALHVTGVAPLSDWQIDRSVYDNIAFPPMDIDGWTRTPLGLLQGPADRKGIA
jgi:sugar/nucleoside kinase (ribokinase family)